ncbi:hypothetical protein RHSIM_Rhsim10G0151000 [Rhododendron simsii]|uniref:4-alpha-glucanotransferase n=1 Tax=Rhododendron simsii TaxID=118357 RepID=A0A834LCW0_RHOSS|nr:hypothetical protein RHSIM_Rhsim10G0151000 [Rhododendron simsii]
MAIRNSLSLLPSPISPLSKISNPATAATAATALHLLPSTRLNTLITRSTQFSVSNLSAAVGDDLPEDYADWLPKPDPYVRRRAGVLLHPTSFPGSYGIGDLGEQAFRFIDWLHDAGCSLWQVLPLVPPGRKGNEDGSPYSGQDANCGNTLLISLEELVKDGLLMKEELPEPIDGDRVNYSTVADVKDPLIAKVTTPTYDHLLITDSDGSAAIQIMELSAEDNMLRKALIEKGLSVSCRPVLPIAGPPIATYGKIPSPMSWKNMVAPANPLISRMNLHFCLPIVVDNKLCVNIPEAVDSAGVLPNEDGFFFYQFDKAGTYRPVIQSGPWHFGGRLMVLKQWHPQLTLVNGQLAKIPLWAHFYNVPLELWTEEVESWASFPIRVWYPWKSLKCDSCHVFGHESCEAKEVPMVSRQQVWVAKPPVLSVVGAPYTNIAAVVSPNKVSPLAGGFVVASPIVLPPPMNHLDDIADGCTDNGEMEISKSHGSSSGTKAGENMFSVLQSLQGDEGQVSLENSGGDPITLPTDEEFDTGMTLDLTSMVSPPKRKGRGRSNGVKKPMKDGDSAAKRLVLSEGDLKCQLEEFKKDPDVTSWLEDAAYFAAIDNHLDTFSWYNWPEPLKNRHLAALEEIYQSQKDFIDIFIAQQFLFQRQWKKVRDYAQLRGISVMGDMPIYVGYHSADVWAHKRQFLLNRSGFPLLVSGVPPDAFSETGQLWGSPLYDWKAMEKYRFSWWICRLQRAQNLFDEFRIDHFRGFAGFWAVPSEAKIAMVGQWKVGPGKSLFEAIYRDVGKINIIAEDLGVITEDVVDLRKSIGAPGMAVLQFGFGSDSGNPHLPHNHEYNQVVYTGTHDNDTIQGWWYSLQQEEKSNVLEYLSINGEDITWALIRAALSSVARTAIIPMQDILGLGSSARMNIPATQFGNWSWRIPSSSSFDCLGTEARKLRAMISMYGRL